MAEVIVSEHVRYRSTLNDAMPSLKTRVWDTGPQRPVPPARPVPPKGLHGIEADIAAIELKEAVANFDVQLTRHVALLKEHDIWHARHSGPVVLEMWVVDARDAIRHDTRAVGEGRQSKRRYFIYDQKKPRQGLPVGVEPGASHAEQIERQADDAAALAEAKRADPVFGGLEP
jgi:hypothetical protein